MPKKMIFIIKEKVYRSTLYVFCGELKEAMYKHQKRTFPEYHFEDIAPTSDAAFLGLTDQIKGYLWIEERFDSYDPYHISVVAHEMAHWCFHIMDQIGNTYIHKNEDEPFCHLLSFMVESFYSKLNINGKVKKS